MTTTADLLAAQYTENTGAHMLDSGGAYGRNWERNQGKTAADFLSMPEAWASEWGGITINAFALIAKHLEATGTAARLTADFRAYVKDMPEGEAFYNSPASVEDWLETLGATGPEGIGEPITNNTYNFETLIDAVFLYVEFDLGGTRYVALSYHGGCDVRGGYTDFVIYKGCECWLYAMTDCSIWCDDCERGWDMRGMELCDSETGGLSDDDLSEGCPGCGKTDLTGSISECWGY